MSSTYTIMVNQNKSTMETALMSNMDVGEDFQLHHMASENVINSGMDRITKPSFINSQTRSQNPKIQNLQKKSQPRFLRSTLEVRKDAQLSENQRKDPKLKRAKQHWNLEHDQISAQKFLNNSACMSKEPSQIINHKHQFFRSRNMSQQLDDNSKSPITNVSHLLSSVQYSPKDKRLKNSTAKKLMNTIGLEQTKRDLAQHNLSTWMDEQELAQQPQLELGEGQDPLKQIQKLRQDAKQFRKLFLRRFHDVEQLMKKNLMGLIKMSKLKKSKCKEQMGKFELESKIAEDKYDMIELQSMLRQFDQEKSSLQVDPESDSDVPVQVKQRDTTGRPLYTQEKAHDILFSGVTKDLLKIQKELLSQFHVAGDSNGDQNKRTRVAEFDDIHHLMQKNIKKGQLELTKRILGKVSGQNNLVEMGTQTEMEELLSDQLRDEVEKLKQLLDKQEDMDQLQEQQDLHQKAVKEKEKVLEQLQKTKSTLEKMETRNQNMTVDIDKLMLQIQQLDDRYRSIKRQLEVKSVALTQQSKKVEQLEKSLMLKNRIIEQRDIELKRKNSMMEEFISHHKSSVSSEEDFFGQEVNVRRNTELPKQRSRLVSEDARNQITLEREVEITEPSSSSITGSPAKRMSIHSQQPNEDHSPFSDKNSDEKRRKSVLLISDQNIDDQAQQKFGRMQTTNLIDFQRVKNPVKTVIHEQEEHSQIATETMSKCSDRANMVEEVLEESKGDGGMDKVVVNQMSTEQSFDSFEDEESESYNESVESGHTTTLTPAMGSSKNESPSKYNPSKTMVTQNTLSSKSDKYSFISGTNSKHKSKLTSQKTIPQLNTQQLEKVPTLKSQVKPKALSKKNSQVDKIGNRVKPKRTVTSTVKMTISKSKTNDEDDFKRVLKKRTTIHKNIAPPEPSYSPEVSKFQNFPHNPEAYLAPKIITSEAQTEVYIGVRGKIYSRPLSPSGKLFKDTACQTYPMRLQELDDQLQALIKSKANLDKHLVKHPTKVHVKYTGADGQPRSTALLRGQAQITIPIQQHTPEFDRNMTSVKSPKYQFTTDFKGSPGKYHTQIDEKQHNRRESNFKIRDMYGNARKSASPARVKGTKYPSMSSFNMSAKKMYSNSSIMISQEGKIDPTVQFSTGGGIIPAKK